MTSYPQRSHSLGRENEQQTSQLLGEAPRGGVRPARWENGEKTPTLPELLRKDFVKEKHLHVMGTEGSTVICWEAKGWEVRGGHSRQKDP